MNQNKPLWKVFAADDMTVLRRLCRELNHRESGFYVNGNRYNQARLAKGKLQIRMCSDQWETISSEQFFSDHNGQQIVASRVR